VHVPTPVPLDPFQRREELRLAVLMVALVVTGMTDRPMALASGAASGDGGKPAGGREPRPTTGAFGRRHVRPARSC
jgi:hypothetical protein